MIADQPNDCSYCIAKSPIKQKTRRGSCRESVLFYSANSLILMQNSDLDLKTKLGLAILRQTQPESKMASTDFVLPGT